MPTDLIAPEYRYPDNEQIPAWARGKSASEILALTQGLVESVGRGGPSIPQQPAPLPLPTDDEFATAGQVRQHVQSVQQQALQSISPYLRTVADQQATMSYNFAKKEQPDIFKKYEPEILTRLNSVPRENWTLDVIANAVNLVKGTHVDEIAAEKVRQLESTYESTLRSTGRAGVTQDSTRQETTEASLEKLPPQWRNHANAVGITAETVRSFCYANDMTIDEFFKQFSSGLVTDAVADVKVGSRL